MARGDRCDLRSDQRQRSDPGSVHLIVSPTELDIVVDALRSVGNVELADRRGSLTGETQIIPWYQAFVTAFPDIKHEIRNTVEEGDTGAIEVRVSGTHSGPLASATGSIAPSGRGFAIDYVDVARFKDGRIARETELNRTREEPATHANIAASPTETISAAIATWELPLRLARLPCSRRCA
jgi:ketosteroid isomerase-like protein